MNVLTALQQVPDFRRAQGQRHELSVVLSCLLLGTMNGARSWRELEAFVQRHRVRLLECLRPRKGRLPSYSTLRRVLQGVDFDALSAAFLAWARQTVPLGEGDWLALDGKSLRGTATQPFAAQQNFTALVSLFCHQRGVVLQCQAYENQQQSEAHVVEQLLSTRELCGAGVSLDALHARKKPVPASVSRGGIT